MTFKKSLILILFLSFSTLFSQNEDDVLFTIDESPVYASEFMRVYYKNLSIVQDEDQKDIKNYLELFINYKLKIKQARDYGMDTIPNYIKELSTYKQQLIEPYMKDQSVVDELVKEAYNRSLTQVKASHILIRNNVKNPSDTVSIYNKALEARTKIMNGADFETIAKQYSEDQSVNRNSGNLGYFSVFDMVYPFENAAFNTNIGEVSMPFRSKFGYHILKVFDKRKTKGEIEAAHIMLKNETENSESKINDIYKKLIDGEDFEHLAKTQSEDTYSAKKNGSLGRFGSGRMIKEFEDVAFSLKNVGDISKPFKTKFGWHIIKLNKKFPIKSFNEVESELNQKIKRGDRSKIIKSSIVNKLRKQYDINIYGKIIDEFKKADWSANFASIPNEIMKINSDKIVKDDLSKFLRNRVLTDDLFAQFEEKMILEYYKNHLQDTNKEYAHTLQEYEDGLLLFEILQSKIWDKSKDSLGVQNYYNTHKHEFVLPERIEGDIVSANDKRTAKIIQKYLKNGYEQDSIKSLINTDDKINAIFKSGVFTKDDSLISSKYKFKKGVSKIYNVDGKYIIIDVQSILPNEQQNLDDIKGKVINNYQEVLEKEWIEELRSSYTVKKNKSAIDKILN